MVSDNEIEYKIEGDSIDECKKKLYDQYGKDYLIKDKKVEFRRAGLFKRQKAVTVVTYVINHQKSYNISKENMYSFDRRDEEEQLQRNRDEILQKQSAKLMSSQMIQMNNTLEEFKKDMNVKLQKLAIAANEKHDSIKKIDDLLEQNAFSFSYINMIEEKIRNEFSLEQLDNYDLVERRVVDWIGESISVVKQSHFRPPHVYILVGPTGVGKTTTLVKLAVQFVREYAQNQNGQRPNICFITTDAMRVGAMEQLERWGKHMSSRVYKAERSEDLKSIYEENRDSMDAFFIDTSGFSPKDATHLAQMKLLLEVPGMNPDIYLTVMASTKVRDLQNIMQNYEPFGYSSVIVTKCDESEQLGNVISVLHEKHKSISYVTHGQVASRDIDKADVVNFLIRLENFKVDRVHIEDKFGE
ncbi:MAG: hypothetical protein SO161_08410 [Treponema sp.]|nr:hypothetical protein [Treponema sp.]